MIGSPLGPGGCLDEFFFGFAREKKVNRMGRIRNKDVRSHEGNI